MNPTVARRTMASASRVLLCLALSRHEEVAEASQARVRVVTTRRYTESHVL
jgi:hypothetical protein